ncbi:hypothetical protein M409DRAFT_70505 [Zasmidium cellare ATCC 36951]|uniref:FAD dependent oxidoreductase domain-containing protein n=1 Tax=Zasmidium cellare ATCC 36951 TaxID=1080233 RepID=A0A6A6BZZ3_ZASCE|nr:uncharacterized protein M409DRAFT_70505 [Zasmidium cellare ATCC 36951]KAF2160341.1 hypothetical protein M409DRAFT_70505 [Zasmidium cellare ATCC 36951]
MTRSKGGKRVAIVGAGIFGLSLAVALNRKGHHVTIFDQYAYDQTGYQPSESDRKLVASIDHNKIFRASYGKKIAYQQLALESRKQWLLINEEIGAEQSRAFVPCGMLRVQATSELSALEKETLASMERDGIRDTQFVKGDPNDRQRATDLGWGNKLLDFAIPADDEGRSFEAVLDSLAGFTRSSDGCAYYQELAKHEGVQFCLGEKQGCFASLIETTREGRKKATGLKTADGNVHEADTVVIAAGSFSTQLLPDLSYHIESSAGSIATFKIDNGNEALWNKYSPERFPVMTWKSAPRNKDGKDIGSVYVFPRTPDGLIKIGYRGVKFTNFEPAPENVPFTQHGKWSIPLPPADCKNIPDAAADAVRNFVSIFLPEFKDAPFHATHMCWYTDTLDNSFLIDYVPTYANDSVFVCTGGSGHGAKFMPVLGDHAADIFENKMRATTPMYEHWHWREDAPRRNGLEEGPGGPRDIGSVA